MPASVLRRAVVALAAALVLLAAAAPGASAYAPPPANGTFDYQIGGAHRPRAGVAIVSRDRLAAPAGGGVYDVCYVNAFQTQPGDARFWTARHPDLLVRKGGRRLIDPDWPDEFLLDTSTAAKRRALMRIVGPWIDRCARDGFLAVEPDNLDSWTRSRGVLRKAHNRAFATLLARRAHRAGLAIAQKNTTELLGAARAIGFDFAIAEECQVWRECGDYMRVHGDRVYEIEYVDAGGLRGFRAACAARGDRIAITYRDRDVLPRGARGHVARFC